MVIYATTSLSDAHGATRKGNVVRGQFTRKYFISVPNTATFVIFWVVPVNSSA